MENMINSVQNGTYKRLDKAVGIVKAIESNQEQGLRQIRVLEYDKNIVIEHHITDRERFVSQYSHFAVKTAQSTVEMCRVVHEAKVNLSKDEFLSFCNDIGHKSEDSTVRKYLAIGSVYGRLIQYTNLLPNSWTSIYEITQIPSEKFDALVRTGNSMATMTGAQIKILTDKSKKSDVDDSAKSDDLSKLKTAASTLTASVGVTSVNCNSVVDSLTNGSVNSNTKVQQENVSLNKNSNSKPNSTKEKTSLNWNIVVSFKKPPSNETYWDLTEIIESFYFARNEDIEVDAYEA